MRRTGRAAAWVAAALLATGTHARAQSPPYGLIVEREWLTLADGTRLAATIFRPDPRSPDERFPVLLEMLPYRKDDFGVARDHPAHAWFARRGFISARVDVRGTGSSEGVLPEREYSEREIRDAVEVIALLAAMPGSNGAVGMWGISWSGFNALQVAMRAPPGLRAILVAHASEDLYEDDSHFIDGLPTVTWYELTIDHWNGLPRTPDYAVDEAYYAERFDREPWIFQKYRHPRDGAWWGADRRGPLKVPTYVVAGLHDGYRDAVFRMAERGGAPLRAEIGPWGHGWPHSTGPGPRHEWGARAVRWWNHWLRGEDDGILDEPALAVYVRSGPVTDDRPSTTPGEWRWADLPYRPAGRVVLHAGAGGLHPAGSSTAPPATDTLLNDPASGTTSGLLWWEVPPDMRRDDAGALVYDGARLDSALVVVGMPRVRLRIGAADCEAHWIVRLEDVRPDGRVDFVTGGGAGASCAEAADVGGGQVVMEVPLRFVTWTFRPGHRVRLAVTNAQFPMVWPSPGKRTVLVTGDGGTTVELPLPALRAGPGPSWPAPERRESTPGLEHLTSAAPEHSRVVRDRYGGTVSVEEAWGEARRYAGREWSDRIQYAHRVVETDPSRGTFEGEARFTATTALHTVEVISSLRVESDDQSFTVVFSRRLLVDGEGRRERVWRERFARDGG